jgi:TolB-like protein/Flp pilus assembly protein TadD
VGESKAVFLSYASDDSEAAQRIADSLKAAGVEVWFDRTELRGGEAWDRRIRQQIHDCRLFIALISTHTDARDEGYFRREWRLAVERAGDMAEDKAFIVPVAIDDTSERSARVPDSFRHLQWTRLQGGEASSAFATQVARLLGPSEPQTTPTSSGSVAAPAPVFKPAVNESIWGQIKRHKVVEWTLAYVAFGYALLHGVEVVGRAFEWSSLPARLTLYLVMAGLPLAITVAWYHGHRAQRRVSGSELSILIVLLVICGSVLWFFQQRAAPDSNRQAPSAAAAPAALPSPVSATTSSFNPPRLSVAVLPFVNLSGDKSQDYLSDGITEELLNSLSRVNDLHVISRTSSFAFKGKDVDVGTIARQLNVGTVLEGSVRRSGNMVRVTVQLIDTVTGFHLWSQTYDRDLGDIFKLETDIANATASALKITLFLNKSVSIELAGTLNAEAVDAYFRGMRTRYEGNEKGDHFLRAASEFTEAIRLDPKFALAFAQRSEVLNDYAAGWATGSAIQENLHKAEMDARQAIVLAPEFAAPHVALAYYFMSALDLQGADTECARARTLEPNNVRYLEVCGNFAIQIGRTDAGLVLSRQMVELNPGNWGQDWLYGEALLSARRYEEALAIFKRVPVTELDSDFPELSANKGFAYYQLGRFEEARKSCALDSEVLDVLVCQAVAHRKLGQDKEAQAALAKFMKLRGDSDPYAYAEIYAQWGDTAKAMDWLRKAAAFRDTGLILLKIDPFMDPIRGEPEFKEILKSMNFPD